jgi:hypothetical protein
VRRVELAIDDDVGAERCTCIESGFRRAKRRFAAARHTARLLRLARSRRRRLHRIGCILHTSTDQPPSSSSSSIVIITIITNLFQYKRRDEFHVFNVVDLWRHFDACQLCKRRQQRRAPCRKIVLDIYTCVYSDQYQQHNYSSLRRTSNDMSSSPKPSAFTLRAPFSSSHLSTFLPTTHTRTHAHTINRSHQSSTYIHTNKSITIIIMLISFVA